MRAVKWLSQVRQHPIVSGTAVVFFIGFLLNQFLDWAIGGWLAREVWIPLQTLFLAWTSKSIGAIGLLLVVGFALTLFVLIALAFLEGTALGRWVAATIRPRLRRRGIESAQAEQTLREEVQRHKEGLARYQWLLSYRRHPPSVGILRDEDALLDARREVARLAVPVEKLHEAIGPFAHGLLQRYWTQPRESIGHMIAISLHQEVIQPTLNLALLVRAPGDTDPRVAFKAFYEQYSVFRSLVAGIIEDGNISLSAVPSYDAWREADSHFFSEVDRLPSFDGIYELRRMVEDMRKEGHPVNLEAVSRRSSVANLRTRLGSLSESESQFLGLFREGTASYGEHGESLLPYSTYSAGHGLVRSGILTVKADPEIEPTLEVFWASWAVREVLQETLFPNATLEESVHVRLDRVASGVGSGTGARRGGP